MPGKGEDGQPAGLVEETVLLDDHRYHTGMTVWNEARVLVSNTKVDIVSDGTLSQQLLLICCASHLCRYIADVLAEGRVAREAAGGDAARLLFKKRMFRETDEAISEPIFISLSYVQAQHDYLEVYLHALLTTCRQLD